MNTILKIFISITLFQISVFAHTLLLNAYNNDDNNTIQVEGIFSTGEPAVGAQIRLESLLTNEILYKKRLPIGGELTIQIPQENYTIILDGGPGHTIKKEGIAPIKGFKKTQLPKENNMQIKKEKIKDSKNQIIIFGLSTAIFLFFLTLWVSIRNTNKLLKKLK